MNEGLRIYNLFPTLAGPIAGWTDELPRIAAMGFNAVYVNPFHYPGFSGSLYAVKDYYRLNPRFRGTARQRATMRCCAALRKRPPSTGCASSWTSSSTIPPRTAS
jgi:glycosidase